MEALIELLRAGEGDNAPGLQSNGGNAPVPVVKNGYLVSDSNRESRECTPPLA